MGDPYALESPPGDRLDPLGLGFGVGVEGDVQAQSEFGRVDGRSVVERAGIRQEPRARLLNVGSDFRNLRQALRLDPRFARQDQGLGSERMQGGGQLVETELSSQVGEIARSEIDPRCLKSLRLEVPPKEFGLGR